MFGALSGSGFEALVSKWLPTGVDARWGKNLGDAVFSHGDGPFALVKKAVMERAHQRTVGQVG